MTNKHNQQNSNISALSRVLSQTVHRIKSEPLLFIIAIIILIITLVMVSTGLGSTNFRMTLSIIALLAIIGIVAHYVVSIRINEDASGHTNAAEQKSADYSEPSQEINITKGAHLEDVLQEGKGVVNQRIAVSGKGTRAKNLVQSSKTSTEANKASQGQNRRIE